MKNRLMLGASLLAAASLAGAASSSPARAPRPQQAPPVDPSFGWPSPVKRAQTNKPKQKNVGPKRRKVRVSSFSSHHHARYLKREKKRRQKNASLRPNAACGWGEYLRGRRFGDLAKQGDFAAHLGIPVGRLDDAENGRLPVQEIQELWRKAMYG